MMHKANLTDDEKLNEHRDGIIVKSVTASIEKIVNWLPHRTTNKNQQQGGFTSCPGDASQLHRQRILYAEKSRGTINLDGRNVSSYQDFSREVLRKRKETVNARRLPREAGIWYLFLYPAVIRSFHPVPPSRPWKK